MNLPFGGKRTQKSKPTPRRRLGEQTDVSTAIEKRRSQKRSTFRRNSTLTGSTSPSLRSATETEGAMQSPRAAAHHLRRQRRRLGGLLVVGIASAIFLAAFVSQFTAEVTVTVVGQVRPLTDQQKERIEQPVYTYLNNRPLERVRPFLVLDNLTAYLQSEGLRDIETVAAVRGNGWGKSVIQVKVREPVARWSIGGQQRFVDKSGAVFAVNYFDTPTVSIRDESGIRSGSEAEVQAVTSGRFLEFVGQSVGLLGGHGLRVDSVVIPPATTRQVEILIGNDNPVPTKMTIDRPAGEQAEDAARAYGHLAGEGGQPRYIDVRVSGMAYYRPQ